jgi:hypothetical protein
MPSFPLNLLWNKKFLILRSVRAEEVSSGRRLFPDRGVDTEKGGRNFVELELRRSAM